MLQPAFNLHLHSIGHIGAVANNTINNLNYQAEYLSEFNLLLLNYLRNLLIFHKYLRDSFCAGNILESLTNFRKVPNHLWHSIL